MRREQGQRRFVRIIAILTAPTLLTVVIALCLMQWHMKTRVKFALEVDQVGLTLAADPDGENYVPLVDYGQTPLVRIDRLTRIALAPGTLEIADEEKFDLKSNSYPEDAWEPMEITRDGTLELVSSSDSVTSAATLQSADAARPGTIKLVRAGVGAEVTMGLGKEKTGDQSWLTLSLNSTAADVDLVFPDRFLLFADYMQLTRSEHPPLRQDTFSLRVGSPTNTAVHVEGSTSGLVLQLEPIGSVTTLLPEGRIWVSAVDFTRQGPSGERLSSLIGPGSLSYPDLPAIQSLPVVASEFVSLRGLENARIESLGMAMHGNRISLKLTIDTIASRVLIGARGQFRDARLTWFQWLWHNSELRALLAIVMWIFPTMLAGYKLWQETRPRCNPSG